MKTAERIENALDQAVATAGGWGSPPRLAAALRYAVFPGGHRIRPQLTLAVARACGDKDPAAVDAAAAAVELLHCASLAHDDLPCFDDADTRRGKASLHKAFGEPLAVLAGDALIVLAFETIARGARRHPARMASLISIVGAAVGGPRGIVAGQAWECEPAAPLQEYQRAKTGALFIGSTQAGAAACGYDPAPWRALGDKIGEAYQVADDLRDVLCDAEELGKPVGQDAARLRPNAAALLGVAGAKARLVELVEGAVASIPQCPGQEELRGLIKAQTMAFFPRQLAAVAAA
jgi:geranylgeranyl diphosphate synthase type II